MLHSDRQIQSLTLLISSTKESGRPISERVRFDEVADISTSDYTFMVRKDRTEPIYTRHSISSIVTKHKHPFSTLPRFSLFAHPVFVITRAYGMLIWHGDASDKIRQIGRAATRALDDEFVQTRAPSPLMKTPPASHHRLFRSCTTLSFSATSHSPENPLSKAQAEETM